MKCLLLLLLVCVGLWLVVCLFLINVLFILFVDWLIVLGGVLILFDCLCIVVVIVGLFNCYGFVVGCDGVLIFWCVFDFGDYGVWYYYFLQCYENGFFFDIGLSLVVLQLFCVQVLCGIVVLLYGWMMNGDLMLLWLLQLVEFGYCVVMFDLCNYGQFGVGLFGYGIYELDDVVDVIGELCVCGEVIGLLYLFGVFYGVVMVVFIVDKLGDQVVGVVVMELFVNVGVVICMMILYLMGLQLEGLKVQVMVLYVCWCYGGQDINQVIVVVSCCIDVDLDCVDVVCVLVDICVCVLLLYGQGDQYILVSQGWQFVLVNLCVYYIEMCGEDYIILLLWLDLLVGVVDDWMVCDEYYLQSVCLVLQLLVQVEWLVYG